MRYFDTGVLLKLYMALEFGATEFCSFDLRQSRMAAAAGLTFIS